MARTRKVGIPSGGTTGQVLKKTTAEDYATEWGAGGGGGLGDVVGPGSSTNGAVVLYDGVTGKLIKNSTILPTTVGIAIANLTNPSAVRFIRINADNSVTARTAAEVLSDIGAQASGSYQPLDSDLTTIAAIDSTQSGGAISTIGAGWIYRTWAQIKSLLVLVKADVGLGNVDNTSDANKPVSTAQQTALDLKANIASPTFTGTVGGITKSMVGLGNVDNTSNATERAATATLTNKRITQRTGTATSSVTPTINTDDVDFYSLTAQAVDITSFTSNLSGTPTQAQQLWIAITGTAARAITWGASFEAGAATLPTTTVSTTRLDILFIYTGSIWRCMAQG